MKPRPIVHGTDAGYHAERRRGLPTCDACRAAHAVASAAWIAEHPRRPRHTGRPAGRPVGSCNRRNEVLDEWEFWRDLVSFEAFAPKVGMTVGAWARMYQRARKAGDPRAVRHQVSTGRRVA